MILKISKIGDYIIYIASVPGSNKVILYVMSGGNKAGGLGRGSPSVGVQ